jgi:predicted ATPase
VPPTPLIGREDDLERLRAMVLGSQTHLVTLTSTGGVGKTRLSLAAASSMAHTFEHAVFFAALAAVSDADVMWKTLADSLHVTAEGPGLRCRGELPLRTPGTAR